MAGIYAKILTYILAVCVFTLASSLTDEKTPCDIVGEADRIGYEGELLNDKVLRPYMMTIDYTTNTLFFGYNVIEIGDIYITARYVDLKTKAFGDVSSIKGGFTTAVDDKNHEVYIGGRYGIYKYDYATKTGTKISAENVSCWNMFYKDKLYCTDWYSRQLHTFEDGQSMVVDSLKDTEVSIITVDKNNNVFLSNDSGLFKYDINFKEGKYIGRYAVNSMTSDRNGDIYFSTPGSLNKIEADSVKKLFDFRKLVVFGIAVEADGSIIYSENKSIFRLKPTKAKCPKKY